jgi:hypothetical protein
MLSDPVDFSNRNTFFNVYDSNDIINRVVVSIENGYTYYFIADDVKYIKQCILKPVNQSPKLEDEKVYFVNNYFTAQSSMVIAFEEK